TAQVSDDCDQQITINNDFEGYTQSCGQVVTVTFTAEDDCGNPATPVTSTITFIDVTAPVIDNTAKDNLTGVYDGTSIEDQINDWLDNHAGATATDACSDVNWSHDYTGLTGGCGNTGSALVTFTATDACGNSSQTTANITFVDEIDIDYTGTTIKSTTNSSATIELSAIIDIESLDDCNVISPSCISFDLTSLTGAPINVLGSTATTIMNGTKYRVVATSPTLTLGSDETHRIYNIAVSAISNGVCYYDGSATSVLTIYKPNGEMVTGGGYIIPTQSSGIYPSPDNEKCNFGFNVKNKTTGIQGEVNYKFENSGRQFQIKSSTFSSLGVTLHEGVKKAEFVCAATLTANKPNETFTGPFTLKVTMTDNGDPGVSTESDMIGFTLTNSNGDIVYSSEWDDYTIELPVGGGNVVVHKPFTYSVEVDPLPVALSESSLTVFPNPTNDKTTFKFVPGVDSKAKLEVYTLNGVLVETLYDQNVVGGKLYEIEYKPALRNSAMILYRLILDDKVYTGKLMFQK
ncbi:MAG: hypothetical protein ACM3ME_02165, partial [Chloroflexota bacterium]